MTFVWEEIVSKLTEKYEIISEDYLTENFGNLRNVPEKFAKILTKGGRAGQNSPITDADLSNIRSESGYNKALTNGMASLESGNAAGVIIYIGSDPLAIITTNGDTFLVSTLSEDLFKKVSRKIHRTGMYDRGTGKYIPPQYYEYTEKRLNKTEVLTALWSPLLALTDSDYQTAQDPSFWKNLNLSIKVVGVDANRMQLKGDRYAAKQDVDSDVGGLAANVYLNQLLTLYEKLTEKYKISVAYPDFDAELQKATTDRNYRKKYVFNIEMSNENRPRL